MTDEQRFDIVTYRLDSAKRLLPEIEKWLLQYGHEPHVLSLFLCRQCLACPS